MDLFKQRGFQYFSKLFPSNPYTRDSHAFLLSLRAVKLFYSVSVIIAFDIYRPILVRKETRMFIYLICNQKYHQLILWKKKNTLQVLNLFFRYISLSKGVMKYDNENFIRLSNLILLQCSHLFFLLFHSVSIQLDDNSALVQMRGLLTNFYVP